MNKAEVELVNVDWAEIEKIIKRYESSHEALLMIMQDISDIYNYVPPQVVPFLAERLGVKESMIYSVATFYKTISLEPRGKFVVNVCTGTACHVRGAERIMDALKEILDIKAGETTSDLNFTLQAVRCVGCCASGPVIAVNRQTYGGLDRSGALRLIKEYKQKVSQQHG
jgi:NADH:ubiquinone oxidoreductase subunit E